MVLSGGFVLFSLIYAHAPTCDHSGLDKFVVVISHHSCASLLGHNMNWTYQITVRERIYDTCIQQFPNFFLYHILENRVQPALRFH
jgi:hypothetical protein